MKPLPLRADDAPRGRAPEPVPPEPFQLEPANRAALAKRLFQTPLDEPERCFECVDPLGPADQPLVYRSTRFEAIVGQAERVGSTHIESVDARGRRQAWNRLHGVWQAQAGAGAPPACASPRSAAPPPGAPADAGPGGGDGADPQAAAIRVWRTRQLESELQARFVVTQAPALRGDSRRPQTHFRRREDSRRVAFSASLFQIAAPACDPALVRSMLDLAEVRQWPALRVRGTPAFRRMVWIEAAVRGLPTQGHSPSRDDLHQVRRERENRQVESIERLDGASRNPPIEALGAWLQSQALPPAWCEAVLRAAQRASASCAATAPAPGGHASRPTDRAVE